MNKSSLSTQKYPISVSVVIPLYNNEVTSIKQIKEVEIILKHTCRKYEIILSDDNSLDRTADLLKKNFRNTKNIKIFTNKKNLGIAKNIMKLYRKAQFEYTLLFSVDGDWNTVDVKKLIVHIYMTNSDIVLGKRNIYVYSPYRRLISFFYNFLPKLLFGVNTIDAGSIKIFKTSLLKKIRLSSKSVFFEAELIIKAIRNNYKVSHVLISFKRSSKKTSKGGKFILIFQSIIDLIKLRYSM